MDILSICSGIGSLDLGLRIALPDARTVCYVEREAFACEVLAARIADGSLDDAPVWTDLTTFDGKPWRGVVDCIAAGFPCQPVSVAGKRHGQQDARWIWRDIARIIREVEPRFVFLENVPGLLSANDGTAFGEVLGSLAEIGFDAEWCVLRASDVGASHRRARVFILAHRNSGYVGTEEAVRARRGAVDDGSFDVPHRDCGRLEEFGSGGIFDGERQTFRHDPDGCDEDVGYSQSGSQPGREIGWDGRQELGQGCEAVADSRCAERRPEAVGGSICDGDHGGRAEAAGGTSESGPDVAHAECSRWPPSGPGRHFDSGDEPQAGCGERAHSIGAGLEGRSLSGCRCADQSSSGENCGEMELPIFPPGPGDIDAWREILQRWSALEPAVRRMADGTANRLDRLRACGNSVVPIQAAAAFRFLKKVVDMDSGLI